jgi:hypothetical protein
MYGKHQTSFEIKHGQLKLDKKTQSEYTADPDEIINQNIKKDRKL